MAKKQILSLACCILIATTICLPIRVRAQTGNEPPCIYTDAVCGSGTTCIEGYCVTRPESCTPGKPNPCSDTTLVCKRVHDYGIGGLTTSEITNNPDLTTYLQYRCLPQETVAMAIPASTPASNDTYACDSTQGGIEGMFTLFGDAVLIAFRIGAVRLVDALPDMVGALISKIPVLGGIGEALSKGAVTVQQPLLNLIDFLSTKWLGAMVWGLISMLVNWVVNLLMQGAIVLNFQLSKENLPLLYGYNFSLTLANFGLLIGVIAIGFGTIWGNKGLNFRQTLVRLIIAAILINFSWFFTTFVANIGTQITKQMYALSRQNTAVNPVGFFGFLNTRCFINRIYRNCIGSGSNIFDDKGNVIGPSGAADQALEAANIFDSQGNVIANSDTDQTLKRAASPEPSQPTTGTSAPSDTTPSLTTLLFSLTVWPYMLTAISSLFSIIGSLTYAVLFLFLLIRYGILMLLIIVAPLVWILYVFPQIKIKGVSVDSWMDNFFKWVFYGPLIIFFLILSSKYIEFASKATAETCGGATIAIASLLIPLIISMGGLFMANKMSAVGSGLMMSGVSWGLKQTSGFLQNVTGAARVRAERRYEEELEKAGGDPEKKTAAERRYGQRVKTFEALNKAVQLQAPLGMAQILQKTGIMKTLPKPITFTKEQERAIIVADLLKTLDPTNPSYDQAAVLQLNDNDVKTIMADTSSQGRRNNRNLDSALQTLLLRKNAGALNPNQLDLLNKFNKTAIARTAIAGYAAHPELLTEIKSDAFYQLSPEVQNGIKFKIKDLTPKTDKDSIKLLSKIDGNILATTIAEQVDAGVTDINVLDKLGSLSTDSIKTLQADTKKSLVGATQMLLIDANNRTSPTSKFSRDALTKLDGASDEFIRKAVLAKVSDHPTLIAELKEKHLKGLSDPEKETVLKTTAYLLKAAVDPQSPIRADSRIALARTDQNLRRDVIISLAEQTGNEIFITELKPADIRSFVDNDPQKLEQTKTIIEKLIPQLFDSQQPLTEREQLAKDKLRRLTINRSLGEELSPEAKTRLRETEEAAALRREEQARKEAALREVKEREEAALRKEQARQTFESTVSAEQTSRTTALREEKERDKPKSEPQEPRHPRRAIRAPKETASFKEQTLQEMKEAQEDRWLEEQARNRPSEEEPDRTT